MTIIRLVHVCHYCVARKRNVQCRTYQCQVSNIHNITYILLRITKLIAYTDIAI